MTQYYFVIYPADYPHNSGFDRSLVRLHELSSSKAAAQRQNEIEREINDGHLWTIEDAVHKTGRRRVGVMPYSEARDFIDFGKWPCNKE